MSENMLNNIRKLRKLRGYSQEKLGELASTTKTQISRLEKGDRGLSQAWMVRLAKPLGCSPADLLPESFMNTRKDWREQSGTFELAMTIIIDSLQDQGMEATSGGVVMLIRALFDHIDNREELESSDAKAIAKTIIKFNRKILEQAQKSAD